MADVKAEGIAFDPDRSAVKRSQQRNFLSRLTRLVRSVAAPLLPPTSLMPKRTAKSGSDRLVQKPRPANGEAGGKEVEEPPKQATAVGTDPSAPQKRTFQESEAYQANLRGELRKRLESSDNRKPQKISIESLKIAQADGKAVFGSTAPRKSRSATTKLSEGATLHPRALNSQTGEGRTTPPGRHPNREAQIPSVPELPNGSRLPTSQENTHEPHIRPAYGDGFGEETKAARPQLDRRSRSSSRC